MLTTLPPELLLGNKAFAFERMVDTSLAFSKRVMSQLASAGSNRAAVMRPTLTRQQNLRKEYIYQPGFRAKTDACLTPICERHASLAWRESSAASAGETVAEPACGVTSDLSLLI